MRLKYVLQKFEFLKTYFSPFKRLKIKFYAGKIAIGTPYFYPRRWVKITKEEAVEEAVEKAEEYFKNHKESVSEREFNAKVESNLRSKWAVPKIVGFDFVGLGWKTKYDSYRFEWSPIWSFVFFGYQLALVFSSEDCSHYWECWLEYEKNTDKTKSVEARILKARENNPCIWTSSKNGVETQVCYWDRILKPKYLN